MCKCRIDEIAVNFHRIPTDLDHFINAYYSIFYLFTFF